MLMTRGGWYGDGGDDHVTHPIGFTQGQQAFQLSPYMDLDTLCGDRISRVKGFPEAVRTAHSNVEAREQPFAKHSGRAITSQEGFTHLREIPPIIAGLPTRAPRGELRRWIINLEVHGIDRQPAMDFIFITRDGLGQGIRRQGGIDHATRQGVCLQLRKELTRQRLVVGDPPSKRYGIPEKNNMRLVRRTYRLLTTAKSEGVER